MKVSEMFDKVLEFGQKNDRAILTGCAVAGVIASVCCAYKAAPKAEKVIEAFKMDLKKCKKGDKEAKFNMLKKHGGKLVAVMAPTVVMTGATIFAIVKCNTIASAKIATLAAAYNLSEKAVSNLNLKMNEILGESKTREIKDAVMKDKLFKTYEEDKPQMDKVVQNPGTVIINGETVLCKDLQSGRYFYSSAEKINQAIAKCSIDIMTDMYISLNEFYQCIDSPQLTPIPLGDELGWNVDDVQKGGLPIILTAILTPDQKPCLCMDYDVCLRRDFRNLR